MNHQSINEPLSSYTVPVTNVYSMSNYKLQLLSNIKIVGKIQHETQTHNLPQLLDARRVTLISLIT